MAKIAGDLEVAGVEAGAGSLEEARARIDRGPAPVLGAPVPGAPGVQPGAGPTFAGQGGKIIPPNGAPEGRGGVTPQAVPREDGGRDQLLANGTTVQFDEEQVPIYDSYQGHADKFIRNNILGNRPSREPGTRKTIPASKRKASIRHHINAISNLFDALGDIQKFENPKMRAELAGAFLSQIGTINKGRNAPWQNEVRTVLTQLADSGVVTDDLLVRLRGVHNRMMGEAERFGK
jgi:hypothetical protein